MARREIMIAVAGAGILAAFFVMRRAESASLPPPQYDGALYIDEFAEANKPGLIESLMTTLDTDAQNAVHHPNVRAFLDMIAAFEGGPQGYNALFGGGRFESFADHPRIVITAGGYSSSAAGRYQILARTWDDVRGDIGATDFSPYWQDIAATYLIRRRGALPDVIAGRFNDAVAKLGTEWASLPGSPYGQPMRSLDEARQLYAAAGGIFT